MMSNLIYTDKISKQNITGSKISLPEPVLPAKTMYWWDCIISLSDEVTRFRKFLYPPLSSFKLLNPHWFKITANDLDLRPPLQQYTNILVSFDNVKNLSLIISEILLLIITAPAPLADLEIRVHSRFES